MSESSETIADIIAERRAFEFITSGMRGFKKINKEYKDYTDRLDAAHKRERYAMMRAINRGLVALTTFER